MATPSVIVVEAQQGETVEREIRLTVTGGAVAVTPSLIGFDLDESGAPLPRQIPSEGVSFEIDGETFDASRQVRLRVQVDAAASGSHWAAAVFESAPVMRDGIEVVARLVVPIFVAVAGTAPAELVVREVAAVRKIGGDVEMIALLENRGESVARVRPSFAVEEAGDQVPLEIASVEGSQVVILPGHSRLVVQRVGVGDVVSETDALEVAVYVPYGAALVARGRGRVTRELEQ